MHGAFMTLVPHTSTREVGVHPTKGSYFSSTLECEPATHFVLRTHPVGAVVKCFETETIAKDLIPTGNVPCNGSCQRDCVGSYPSRQRCCAASAAHSAETSSTTDCVRQARPEEVLHASDPTQPPVLQRFATASSQQNPPAHSSGRSSSSDIEGLDGCGFTTEEIVSLLWLQHWYQTGGSDRVEPLRQWEFLKYLVLNGKLGR